MAYTKNTWASGDVVTSAKLNNIENGIASGGVLVVNAEDHDGSIVLDKTWKQISEAVFAVLIVEEQGVGTRYKPLSQVSDDGEGQYGVFFHDYTTGYSDEFYTDNENGYPENGGK